MIRRVLESDLGVYVASGVFMILVFAVGVVVLVGATDVTIGSREFAGFAAGFTVFVGVYFVAMAIYRLAIDRG